MSCFHTNIQKQIENKANIGKTIRYTRSFFLTWTRKLMNGTYIVCTASSYLHK